MAGRLHAWFGVVLATTLCFELGGTQRQLLLGRDRLGAREEQKYRGQPHRAVPRADVVAQ